MRFYLIDRVENNDYFFEIKPKNSLGLNIKELAEYKELFYFFTWRDIKVKYKQAALGFLWAVLQPLLLMLIFTVLGRSLKVPSDDMEYSVFTFSGLTLWTIFSSGLTNAGNSMITNAQIIKKIYFPRLIIPISSILVALFDYFMAFLVFILLLVFYRQPLNISQALYLWPAALLLTVIGTLGPGCLLAALNIKYRDFRYIIPFLVQVLFFLTPVIYPVSVLKYQWLQSIIALNPMYGAITIFRLPFTKVAPDTFLLAESFLSAFVFLLIGLVYFRRTEMYFADLA